MRSLFGINIGGGICGVCNSPLNVINSKRVGEGYICKTCLSNISNYYDKKNNTYEAIVNHIRQRMNERREIEQFYPTLILGECNYIFIDDKTSRFIISSKDNYRTSNPDLFFFSDVISCKKRIETKKEEVRYKDSNDNLKSFVPQYFAYSYNFYVDIQLNVKGYKIIQLKLNNKNIDNNQELKVKMNSDAILDKLKDAFVSKAYDGMNTNNSQIVMKSPDYIRFDNMADQIVTSLTQSRNREMIRICAYCGSEAEESTKFCVNCGASLLGAKLVDRYATMRYR